MIDIDIVETKFIEGRWMNKKYKYIAIKYKGRFVPYKIMDDQEGMLVEIHGRKGVAEFGHS
jgi:hypothetical protein